MFSLQFRVFSAEQSSGQGDFGLLYLDGHSLRWTREWSKDLVSDTDSFYNTRSLRRNRLDYFFCLFFQWLQQIIYFYFYPLQFIFICQPLACSIQFCYCPVAPSSTLISRSSVYFLPSLHMSKPPNYFHFTLFQNCSARYRVLPDPLHPCHLPCKSWHL